MAGVINQNENKLTSNNGVLNEESFVERTPVTHGIYLQAKIASSRNIICVCHNFHSGQYLVHYEDGEMELYLSDGSHEKAESVGLFDGVVYASRSNVYIAWNKEGTLKVKAYFYVVALGRYTITHELHATFYGVLRSHRSQHRTPYCSLFLSAVILYVALLKGPLPTCRRCNPLMFHDLLIQPSPQKV